MKVLKRIVRLLLPEERKKGWKVVGSIFLSALLDFVGLAMLLPVLYYLLEGGEQREAALLFSLLAGAIVVLKALLVTCFTRYQTAYLLAFYKRLSFSLFSSYYKRGLLFIRKQGSNKLGYEVNALCFAFSQNLLAPLLRMMGDGLLILLVTVALILYDGTTVLVLYASFLPFMLIYWWGVRKQVKKYGERELHARREQARVVADTFRGYTELEVNNAFPTLQKHFVENLERVSHNRLKLGVIMRLPLFLSELSVVVGLVLLVLLGTGDVKLLVGVFAVAAFRLLPALRGILAGWTQLQNAMYSLNVIEEGLAGYDEAKDDAVHPLAFNRGITVAGLGYTYPDGEQVFDSFDCCIRKGEYVGICGCSGAGKSTFFNLLLGLLEPTMGEIRIDDVRLTANVRTAWMKRIGYVPQEVFIFDGTLAENIALGCKEIDRLRVERILKQVCLEKWSQTLGEGIDTVLSEAGASLSGGQKQRIGIARALYKEAELLLLDEATSALDNETEREINETLHTLKQTYTGLTILSIAHRESSLGYCDRVITITNKHE